MDVGETIKEVVIKSQKGMEISKVEKMRVPGYEFFEDAVDQ